MISEQIRKEMRQRTGGRIYDKLLMWTILTNTYFMTMTDCLRGDDVHVTIEFLGCGSYVMVCVCVCVCVHQVRQISCALKEANTTPLREGQEMQRY